MTPNPSTPSTIRTLLPRWTPPTASPTRRVANAIILVDNQLNSHHRTIVQAFQAIFQAPIPKQIPLLRAPVQHVRDTTRLISTLHTSADFFLFIALITVLYNAQWPLPPFGIIWYELVPKITSTSIVLINSHAVPSIPTPLLDPSLNRVLVSVLLLRILNLLSL